MFIYILFAFLWSYWPTAEPLAITPTHEVWVAINFGYPTLDCFGRGRICRLEPIPDSAAARPAWSEGLAVLRSESSGGLSLSLWPPSFSKLVYTEQFPNDSFLLDTLYHLPETLLTLIGSENQVRTLLPGNYPIRCESDARHRVEFSVIKTANDE